VYLNDVSSRCSNSSPYRAAYPTLLSNFVKNKAAMCGGSLSLADSPSAALECDDAFADMVEGMRVGS
jgi:hypothetical protein